MSYMIYFRQIWIYAYIQARISERQANQPKIIPKAKQKLNDANKNLKMSCEPWHQNHRVNVQAEFTYGT